MYSINIFNHDTYVCNAGVSNNSRTYITRPDNSSFKVYENHEPLSCANMKEFWLSWINDKVQLGSGRQLGQYAFITLNDSVPTSKNYLAVSTGFGASGYWIFHSGKIFLKIDADTFHVKTIDAILENLVKKSSAFCIRANTSTANANKSILSTSSYCRSINSKQYEGTVFLNTYCLNADAYLINVKM